jgi:hypothetical protein
MKPLPWYPAFFSTSFQYFLSFSSFNSPIGVGCNRRGGLNFNPIHLSLIFLKVSLHKPGNLYILRRVRLYPMDIKRKPIPYDFVNIGMLPTSIFPPK